MKLNQFQKLQLTNKAPIFYAVSFLIGMIYLLVGNNDNAIIYLGLAFIFDPFESQIPFPLRHWTQKTWLIIHLLIVLSIVTYEFLVKITHVL